jgi:hypothetical protein
VLTFSRAKRTTVSVETRACSNVFPTITASHLWVEWLARIVRQWIRPKKVGASFVAINAQKDIAFHVERNEHQLVCKLDMPKARAFALALFERMVGEL